MKDGKTKVMDNILIPPNSNVFIIGFKNIEVIEYCINCDANLIVGVDVNLELVEMTKNKFQDKKNVEIAHWDGILYPRWIEKFDIVISMEDICSLKNPRQFVRDVSMVTRKSGKFIIVCNDEKSDNTVSELLYGKFMTISRAPREDAYIIKSIKLPNRR